MSNVPMTMGLVSEEPKRYKDNPSRNEPHVILIDYRDGSSTLSRMYRDYGMAKKDLHIIHLLGEVNDKRVKDVFIIPVSKVNDVLPDITAKVVRSRGYMTEQETLDYQNRMHYQRAMPKKNPQSRTKRI